MTGREISYLFSEWAFGRICNPTGLSVSIFNALFRIKNPDIHCVGITNPDEHYFVY